MLEILHLEGKKQRNPSQNDFKKINLKLENIKWNLLDFVLEGFYFYYLLKQKKPIIRKDLPSLKMHILSER